MTARVLLSASVIGIAVALSAGMALRAQQQQRFPHAQHARMFPLCEGCHEGVATDERAAVYPQPATCTSCHNGVDQPRVAWTQPPARETSLRFSHAVHERRTSTAGDELECSGCHVPAGAGRMDVTRRAEPERCISCHAHRASSHYVDARCEQCHAPLAATALPYDRVSGFTTPPSHAEPRFLQTLHGELARTEPLRCAVCHTRETCASCHVDAATKEEIQRIPAAQAARRLPVPEARYFVPESHRETAWIEAHGKAARSEIATCAGCHTRDSCQTCHTQQRVRVMEALPRRADVAAPGVTIAMSPPASHAAPFFPREHGAAAAARPQSCAQCHARTECETCHRSSEMPAAPVALEKNAQSNTDTVARTSNRAFQVDFHPANYLERHASNSWGRQLDCQNCHDTAVFCRSCHEQRGMAAAGRLGSGFHDAQPNWLFNHGRAARQGLESCASCHTQRNCTQCHSETGAFRVNPHGPDFDAARMIARNPRVCYACHLSDPTRRGG